VFGLACKILQTQTTKIGGSATSTEGPVNSTAHLIAGTCSSSDPDIRWGQSHSLFL